MAWRPWRRRDRTEVTQPVAASTYSISDPRLAEIFGVGPDEWSGVQVSESTAMGLSAWWRGLALISGQVAGMGVRAVAERSGLDRPVRSMLDAPAGTDGLWTPYEWSETITLHMINHGNAYLRIVRNGAGAIVQLHPIHPTYVIPRWPAAGEFAVGGKWFRVTDPITGRSADYDGLDILQIPGMSSDGLAGISVLSAARINLGGSIASERASARVMSRGALMGGIATPEEDGELDPDELKAARQEILQHTTGYENAGGIAIINRALKITPWTMTAKDAQFLESRQFGVEDIARWLGVPPHLLMQTDKQTSWGTGVAEQNRGLARYTLPPWTSRIEQRLTRLLRPGVRAAYDYGRLTRPVHEVEVSLVLQELAAGVITRDEARSRLGYPPDGEAIPDAA